MAKGSPAGTKLVFDFNDGSQTIIQCVAPDDATLHRVSSNRDIILNGFKLCGGREPGYGHCLLLQRDLTEELMRVRRVNLPPTTWATQPALSMHISDGENTVVIRSIFIDEVKNVHGVANGSDNELVLVKLVDTRVLHESRMPQTMVHNTGMSYKHVIDFDTYTRTSTSILGKKQYPWNCHPVFNAVDLGTKSWSGVIDDLLNSTTSPGNYTQRIANYGIQGNGTVTSELIDHTNSDFPTIEPKDIDFDYSITSGDVLYDLLAWSLHGLYKTYDNAKYLTRPFNETVAENVLLRQQNEDRLIYNTFYSEGKRTTIPFQLYINFRYTDREESYRCYTVVKAYTDEASSTYSDDTIAFNASLHITMPNMVHKSDNSGSISSPTFSDVESLADDIATLYYGAFVNDQAYDALYFGIIPFIHSAECHTLTFFQDVDGAFKTKVESIDLKKHVFPEPRYHTTHPNPTKYLFGHEGGSTSQSPRFVGIPYDTGDVYEGWGFPLDMNTGSNTALTLASKVRYFNDNECRLSRTLDAPTFDASHPSLSYGFSGLYAQAQLYFHRPGMYRVKLAYSLKIPIDTVLDGSIYVTSKNLSWFVLFDCVNGQSPTADSTSKISTSSCNQGSHPRVYVPSSGTDVTFQFNDTAQWLVDITDPDDGGWAPGWFVVSSSDAPVPSVIANWLEVERIG